ncbi:protein kinase [Balneolaceae bacterium YR4-1]|uniref:non-specific serine/threonine protein kinase n=1 Tax=Halalkalibaculum roseum TaxID=2709311 RepID=A0A6M1SWS5_9BACT|nr:protein kinase [Halalkalibaculum roseum]NGP74997.1 protein kinase [Halalkalibaculum roseum]
MISHYKITEKLGEGGMGVVYKALDTNLDRHVALKFFPESATPSPKDKQRFIREAKSAAALNHPNVCTIHNADEFENRQYIVMEYVEGETLRKKMESGPLSISTRLDYAIQIADALKSAHGRQIVHRDIKPENIMIDAEGRVKVMDFGLAKFKNTGDITKTGDTLGTTAYMSPEQARGKNIDHRTDIWSLGIILYEMFSGRKPFFSEYPQAVIYSILNEEPDRIEEINPDLPAGLSTIIHKALEKDPDKRYREVEKLQEDFTEIKQMIGTTASQSASSGIGIASSTTGFKERVLSPVPITVVGIIAVILLGFYFFFPNQKIDFEERDWVMITDFENRTDEADFSQFLNTILEVGLNQSAYVNLYNRQQVLNILNNDLEISGVKTLTMDVVTKAAVEENVGVIITPTIEQEDNSYILAANIRDITTGTTREVDPVRAENKDAILKAMDQFSKQIRLELGEPQSGISENYTPIIQATTSSLEALKLYAEGMKLRIYDEQTGYDLVEQAVELDPKFALAHAELGMHYYIRGKRQEGEEHFQKALEQMGRLTVRERLWIRAVVEDWRGDREKAIENYKSYLSQYPDDYTAWWRLGYTYLITGKYQNCIDAYSGVVEFNPDDPSAFVNLATCNKALEQNEQALEYYNRAFEINPDMKKGMYVNNEYGFMLVEMGKLEEARETFELMLSEKDKKARGLRSLALLNTYTGHFSKAIDQFKEAALINKSNGIELSEYRDRMYLARAYKVKGMEEEFNRELEEINQLMENMDLSPSWLASAGQLYARNNMLDKAEEILSRIKQNIGNIVATSAVSRNTNQDQAFYYLLKGEVELARKNFEEARESLVIAHNILEMPEVLAYCYYQTGEWGKAKENYLAVLEEKSLNNETQLDWILAHYRLAKIYEQQENTEQAQSYYQKFMNIWKNGDEDIEKLQEARKRMQIL